MATGSAVRSLDLDDAMALVETGACLIDTRDVSSYLDVHIPGSIALLYESGPGFNSRARDCIPLEVPLVLLDLRAGNMENAAAALRGKGFDVRGKLADGINAWAKRNGAPASTEVVTDVPEGVAVLHVNDPGASAVEADFAIPIEKLWTRVDEIAADRVAIAAGFGVRGALAVGILERAGKEVLFWRTRSGR